jgi:hypothetical protein
MASRQSKRPSTFLPRPPDSTFSRSGGLVLNGILIPSCCDDSFTAKSREQGELLTGAVLVKVDFFRVARHQPGNRLEAIWEQLPGRAMARTGLRMMPTFPSLPLKFRKAGFPRYGFKAGGSGRAFPATPKLRVGRFASALRALRISRLCPALCRGTPCA